MGGNEAGHDKGKGEAQSGIVGRADRMGRPQRVWSGRRGMVWVSRHAVEEGIR